MSVRIPESLRAKSLRVKSLWVKSLWKKSLWMKSPWVKNMGATCKCMGEKSVGEKCDNAVREKVCV